jgi:hypothetical protein
MRWIYGTSVVYMACCDEEGTQSIANLCKIRLGELKMERMTLKVIK